MGPTENLRSELDILKFKNMEKYVLAFSDCILLKHIKLAFLDSRSQGKAFMNQMPMLIFDNSEMGKLKGIMNSCNRSVQI